MRAAPAARARSATSRLARAAGAPPCGSRIPDNGSRPRLSNRKYHARKVELPRNRVDDVDLAGIQARREGGRRNFELEQRGVPLRRIDGGSLDDGRFEHLDLAAIEGQAGAEFWCRSIRLGRIVDLVIEEQLLILPHDVGQVRQQLDAVTDERIIGL